MKSFVRWAFGFCFLLCMAGPALSQNRSSGEVRGTVTDASGAVLPGVTVVLVDINTGVKTNLVTNADGIYDSVSTRTGTYNISFEKAGFKKLVRGPLVLQVDTITEDAVLQVGAVTEEVRVNAEGAPLLETESGQQASILDAKTMNELPQTGAGVTGNDWANFTAFLPGGESATHGRVSEGSGAWNAGDAIALNGNLPNYANFLADGATTQLPVSNNNDNLTFESVAEVQVNTSTFSAQYGLGGAVFNQISKGGNNGFHGAAYEYWQNNILNASNYFGNNVPYLRYDEWGGAVGGPIIKNKLFFYFNRDKIYDFSGANQGFTTVPTDAMKAGDFSGSGIPVLYDPSTTTGSAASGTFSRTPFSGNQITNISAVAQAMLKYWPEPNVTCPDGVSFCTNNYFYKQASPNPNLRYFGRIDYDYSQANRLSFSITQKNNNGYNKNQLPCPINCYSGDIDGYQAQVTDTWTISPTLVNELRMGYTKQGNWFVPATNGFDPSTLGLQYAKFTQFPNINIGGANSVNSLNAGTYAIYIENLYDPSDVVTLIRGKHILHFGIEVLMGEGNTTPWGAHDAGSFAFDGNYTGGPSAPTAPNPTAGGPPLSCTPGTPKCTNGVNASTGAGFADFLLGDVQTWGANNQGLTGMRLKSPQAFVQDDIKIRPNFTLNLGLRYMATTGMSEEHNRIGGFDPNLINPVGPFAGTAGSIWFAGQDDRTTSQKPIWDIFLPRVGFAWLVKYNTTIRGGLGLYAYNFSQDVYGAGIGFGSNSTGSAQDPTGGLGSTPLISLDAPAATANAILPYVQASTNPASYITSPSPFSPAYVPYHVSPGKIEEWSLAVEHQFGRDFAGSIAYVGSHGYNLQFPTNLNQITNLTELSSSDVAGCNGLVSGYNGGNSCFRPYPAFAGIGGNNYNAISNYDSLQLQVTKRYASGFSFNVNYTWSHLLDDQDSSGWGSTAGDQNWQIGNNPSANYSNSNFDIRNAFKGYVVYELPFGEGKAYLSKGNALDALVGGWKISSTFITQSGNPFTMFDSVDQSYSLINIGGDTWYPNVVSGVSPHSGNCPAPSGGVGAPVGTINCWFNPAAFVAAAAGTFGDSRRNSLLGPRLTVVNISMGKTFRWRERFAFELRGDFVNAFNHPSFSLPNSNVSSTAEGVINSVAVGPRTGQISGRLSF